MKWCQNCVLPDTRPNLEVGNDGICSACSSHNRRKEIDWSARALEFRTLVKQVKQLKREYDCIIPISGGKAHCKDQAEELKGGVAQRVSHLLRPDMTGGQTRAHAKTRYDTADMTHQTQGHYFSEFRLLH